MSTQRLSFETRVHLALAMAETEVALTGTTDLEVLALIERARFDLRRGWDAAAADCLGRARRLLAGDSAVYKKQRSGAQ